MFAGTPTGDQEASSVDLTSADLTEADLTDANLPAAILVRAKAAGLVARGATLLRARITDADLTGARLDGADLSEADLSRSVLKAASLPGAVLLGSILRSTRFDGADLSGAWVGGLFVARTDLSRASGVAAVHWLAPNSLDRWSQQHAAEAGVAIDGEPPAGPHSGGRSVLVIQRSADAAADRIARLVAEVSDGPVTVLPFALADARSRHARLVLLGVYFDVVVSVDPTGTERHGGTDIRVTGHEAADEIRAALTTVVSVSRS